jgi:hypothetical protein
VPVHHSRIYFLEGRQIELVLSWRRRVIGRGGMLGKCLEMYVVFGAIVIMRLLAVVRRNGNAIASVLYSTKGVCS